MTARKPELAIFSTSLIDLFCVALAGQLILWILAKPETPVARPPLRVALLTVKQLSGTHLTGGGAISLHPVYAENATVFSLGLAADPGKEWSDYEEQLTEMVGGNWPPAMFQTEVPQKPPLTGREKTTLVRFKSTPDANFEVHLQPPVGCTIISSLHPIAIHYSLPDNRQTQGVSLNLYPACFLLDESHKSNASFKRVSDDEFQWLASELRLGGEPDWPANYGRERAWRLACPPPPSQAKSLKWPLTVSTRRNVSSEGLNTQSRLLLRIRVLNGQFKTFIYLNKNPPNGSPDWIELKDILETNPAAGADKVRRLVERLKATTSAP